MPRMLRLLLLFGLFGFCAMAWGETLDDILACNASALGGEKMLGRADNLRLELDIREPTFEVTGTYVASREGYMRIDIVANGQRVFAEGLNSDGAWQWTPGGGVTESRPQGEAALRHGIESPGRFWTLAQLRQRGLRIALIEPDPLAKPEEWQLQLIRDDGSTYDYFLGRETCLPTREISQRAFHPDVDPTEVPVETAFSDPFQVEGVLRFRRSETRRLDTNDWLGTTVVRSIQHNVNLAEDVFQAQ